MKHSAALLFLALVVHPLRAALPPVITSQPENQLLTVQDHIEPRERAFLTAAALSDLSGAPPLAMWFHDGRLIERKAVDLTVSKLDGQPYNVTLERPSISLSDAGNYRMTLLTKDGTTSTGIARVTVVDTAPQVALVREGLSVTLRIKHRGTAPFKCFWNGSASGGTLQDQPGRISGSQTPAMTLMNVTAADQQTYTWYVTDATVQYSGQVKLVVSQAPPRIAPADAQAIVAPGFALEPALILSPVNNDAVPPGIVSYQDLPAGVTAQPDGTLVYHNARAGSYSIRITARNAHGVSNTIRRKLTVMELHPLLTGTFVAGGEGFRLDLVMAPTGHFTAKLTDISGFVTRHSGYINAADNGNWASGVLEGALSRRGLLNVPGLPLSFRIEYPGHLLVGRDLPIDVTLAASISMRPELEGWSKGTPHLFTVGKGVHNFAGQLTTTNPRRKGWSFASLSIGAYGDATIAGRMADGSVTLQSTLAWDSSTTPGKTECFWFCPLYPRQQAPKAGKNGNVPLPGFFNPYGAGGVSGKLALQRNVLTGQAIWLKVAAPQPDQTLWTYPSEFYERLTVAGGTYFIAPPDLNLLGQSPASSAMLLFKDGGLDHELAQTNVLARIGHGGPAVITSPNPSRVTLQCTAATGQFSGTFFVPASPGYLPARSIPFSGLIVPQPDGSHKGVGCFQAGQYPLSSGVLWSGAVELSATP